LNGTPVASGCPSRVKVTVPVSAGPAVDGATADTLAVKVTGWPNVGACGDVDNPIEVLARPTVTWAWFCEPIVSVSPEYDAITVWEPVPL
jgi:hypothetical protein